MRGRGALAAAILVALAMAEPANAAQLAAGWTGGTGSWTDPTKWTTGAVPNNTGGTTYAVSIDNGNAAASKVTLSSATTVSIDSLVID